MPRNKIPPKPVRRVSPAEWAWLDQMNRQLANDEYMQAKREFWLWARPSKRESDRPGANTTRSPKGELDALTKKSRKAGLSREGYCRRILNGAAVKEAPPADVPRLRTALDENRAVEKLIADNIHHPLRLIWP